MRAYAQLDMERQYDGAFQEDDTFFEEDEPSCASPVEHSDAALKAEPGSVPAPVPQDVGQVQTKTDTAKDTNVSD